MWNNNKINNRYKDVQTDRVDISCSFPCKVIQCNLPRFAQQRNQRMKKLGIKMKIMTNTMADKMPERFF